MEPIPPHTHTHLDLCMWFMYLGHSIHIHRLLISLAKITHIVYLWQCTCFKDRLHTDIKTLEVSKGATIRNRYNQEPHLAQDTNGRVTNSHLDTTNESQDANPFPAGDHKAPVSLFFFKKRIQFILHVLEFEIE